LFLFTELMQLGKHTGTERHGKKKERMVGSGGEHNLIEKHVRFILAPTSH
jgi:hypothetical protein